MFELNAPVPKIVIHASRPPRSRAEFKTVVAPENATIIAKNAAPLYAVGTEHDGEMEIAYMIQAALVKLTKAFVGSKTVNTTSDSIMLTSSSFFIDGMSISNLRP